MDLELIVVGGGLAGCEAAWQAAERGARVRLYEMRPALGTPAHVTDQLAELVCSNSLGSNLADRASGVIKNELRRLDSMLLKCAEQTSVPAGGALAVDRQAFAQRVTDKICSHPNITLIREEIREIPPGPAIIASGPLTSPALTQAIGALTQAENLFFFDAIAPIVDLDTVDFNIAFRCSRYGNTEQDEGDYVNCPFDKEQYEHFYTELVSAQRIAIREFESDLDNGVKAGYGKFFEGCLPIEIMARRGPRTLAFGPMRPVGLTDPHTGRRPYAVVQLRQENLNGNLFNIVGFQTNLTFPEQKRVFRLIPGLENVEFFRYGQMHRNTFISSPNLLNADLSFRARLALWFAGQLTGVEGYMGNIATGFLAGVNAINYLQGSEPWILPPTTMIGALCHYISHAPSEDFQPMKANFGILPPLELPRRSSKSQRATSYAQRSLDDLDAYLTTISLPGAQR